MICINNPDRVNIIDIYLIAGQVVRVIRYEFRMTYCSNQIGFVIVCVVFMVLVL